MTLCGLKLTDKQTEKKVLKDASILQEIVETRIDFPIISTDDSIDRLSLKVKHQINSFLQELLTIVIWLLVHDHIGTTTLIIMTLSFMTFNFVCHCVSLKVKKHQLDSFSKSFTRTSKKRYLVTSTWSYCCRNSHHNDTEFYDIRCCVSLKVKHQIKFLFGLCICKFF